MVPWKHIIALELFNLVLTSPARTQSVYVDHALELDGEIEIGLNDSNDLDYLYENTVAAQGDSTGNWLSYSWYYPSGLVREFQVTRRRDGLIAIRGVEGRFEIKSGSGTRQLCQQFDSIHTLCRPLAVRSIGEHWTEVQGNGQEARFHLIGGRMLMNFLSGDGTDMHVIAPFEYPDYPAASAPRVLSPGAAVR